MDTRLRQKPLGDFPVTREEFDQLARRADADDEQARARLHDLLGRPEFRGLGDMAEHARNALVAFASRGDAMIAEAVRLELDRIRDELSCPEDTPAIRIAVDRLALAVVEASLLDATSIDSKEAAVQRRRDQAAQRLERALRLLADLRRSQGSQSSGAPTKTSRTSRPRVTQAA